MSKKQIIILVLTFFLVLGVFLFIFLYLPNRDKNILLIGDYKLKYGLYEGYESEYDPDKEEFTKTKKELILLDEKNIKMNDDMIPFNIKGNKLYVYGQEYFEVKENNKLTLLAGGGIDYEWKKEIKEKRSK